MKNSYKFHLSTPRIRRSLACLLIFALVVTLAPVQSLAQTVQREKTIAGQLPDTATYTVRDCTVTYDTLLQEGLSTEIHITVTNRGTQPISKWQLRFHYPYTINPSNGIQINSHENGYYTFTPTQEITQIASGQGVQFSFTVKGATVPDAPGEIEFIINDEDFAPLPTATPVPTVAVTVTPAATAVAAASATPTSTVLPT